VVGAAGQAPFRPLLGSLGRRLRRRPHQQTHGPVNLVRFGTEVLADGGAFTPTTGTLSRRPMPRGAAIRMVNAGLEGFFRAAALELPRGLRIFTGRTTSQKGVLTNAPGLFLLRGIYLHGGASQKLVLLCYRSERWPARAHQVSVSADCLHKPAPANAMFSRRSEFPARRQR